MPDIKGLTRRDFLKILATAGCGIFASAKISGLFSNKAAFAIPSIDNVGYIHEAMFYDKLSEDAVKCMLCPHECLLQNGQRSFCRVREPKGGVLYTLVYELICSAHVDPIEKKPIYHMLPGSLSFSIATAGCNSRCKYCQNWQISQIPPEESRNTILSCDRVSAVAMQNECQSIAYTYTEPIVFYEYMLDAAKIAKTRNIKNIAVTGGFINPEPAKYASKYLDAANIDLKGFDDSYLKETCGQRLDPLLGAIKIMHDEGVWIELTNLVVPTLNDDAKMIRNMCKWITRHLGQDVPLHFSRFWPMYKLRDLPPTPVETLESARDIAMDEGLRYVYIGNIKEHEASNTYCPKCKKAVITRAGYYVTANHIKNSACTFCGEKIAGIWE